MLAGLTWGCVCCLLEEKGKLLFPSDGDATDQEESMCDCSLPVGEAPLCPIINAPTKPVSRDTVGRHVMLTPLPETNFGFCDAPGCDVVYVGSNGVLITKDQLHVRVGIKESRDPKPVCYCWGFDELQIIEDFHQHGRSTIRSYIQDRVQAGSCRCESTNPSGRCCLGDVGQAIAKARLA